MEQKEIKSGFDKFIEKMGKPSEYNRMYGHHFKSFSAGVEFATQSNQANGVKFGTAKEFLASKNIYGLDTKKRTKEVLEWMEEFASQFKANGGEGKGYSLGQVIKAMDSAHTEGLLYGNNSKYKSPLKDYKNWIENNLTPSIPSSKKFSVEQLSKAMFDAHSYEYRNSITINEFIEGYIASLTPTSVNGGESWDDIEGRFRSTDDYKFTRALNINSAFIGWLQDNYNPPTRK